jgi:hypothetical protein
MQRNGLEIRNRKSYKKKLIILFNKMSKNTEVKCKRCGNKWKYRGLKLLKIIDYPLQYVTCPRCRTSVKLKKGK